MRELQPGTVVDSRYEVIARLGTGGMADVYLASDRQLGRHVALKLLHERFAADEEFVERFRREASSAAGLSHTNVVNVYDRGEWDGTYYIAMEHLEGRSLKRLVQDEGPLDPVRAIDLTAQILRAASFAHSRGVIHRDLKPHNAIVGAADHLKVTDFGIARAGASDMTETGSIMGTAQYLSPEQAQGLAVAEAADIYSIGVVLYELLTGSVPFDGPSAVTIALKQVSETAPPPSTLAPAVSPALDAAVMRALAKAPDQRFASAEEFLTALGEARAAQLAAVGQATSRLQPLPVAAAAPAAPPPGPVVVPGAMSSSTAAAMAALALADQTPPGSGEHHTSATNLQQPATGLHYPASYETAYEYEARRRRPLWPWLIALLMLAAAGLVALLLLGSGDRRVPNVVGLATHQASAVLARAGFHEAERSESSAAVPAGNVIQTYPAPGAKAAEGSTVTLIVSGGPGQVAVPNVVSLARSEANRQLRSAGFGVVEVRAPSDQQPRDHVISSNPAPLAQAPSGSIVTLTISSGRENVTIPSVVGQTFDEASVMLASAGLQVVRVERPSATAKAGTVLDESPPAGTSHRKGSTVALGVAQAQPGVVVPNVTGGRQADAESALQASGLRATVRSQSVTDPGQDGIVLSQDPAGDKQVPKGSRVTLIVGKLVGAPPTTPTTTTPPATSTAPSPGAGSARQ